MLKEIVTSYPRVSIVFLSFLITLGMTLVTKHFTDQIRMKEIKDRHKELSKKQKEHRDDKDKLAEIQKEIMAGSMELMKHSFKPLMITLLPILFIFWWIKNIYIDSTLADTWLWWYIGSGIISSLVLRKALKVV